MSKFESEDIVIFVHGTFASHDKGWVAIDNEFHKKLNIEFHRLTGTYFNWISFKWSGYNSLYERQSAATNLAETINVNHKKFKRVHLIGHSHGGTVIQFALQQYPFLVSNSWKLKMASWTTIGTPFYRYKGKLKLTDRWIFSLSMPIAAIVVLIIALALNKFQISKYYYIPIYIFTYAVINGLLSAKSLQYRLDRVNEYFAKKWFGVYSKYDEVIVGLADNASIKISDKKRPWSSFDPEFDIITYMGKCLNTIIYNYVTRVTLVPYISKSLRNMALGLDRYFYKVAEVTYNPLDNAKVQPIPEFMEEQIIAEVIDDNRKKIGVIRKLMNLNTKNLIDRVREMPENEQPKLVHSNYFENDDIVKAISKHLAVMRKRHLDDSNKSR